MRQKRGELNRASPVIFKTTKQLTRTNSASAKLDAQEKSDTNACTHRRAPFTADARDLDRCIRCGFCRVQKQEWKSFYISRTYLETTEHGVCKDVPKFCYRQK